jgi:hypothetical protein
LGATCLLGFLNAFGAFWASPGIVVEPKGSLLGYLFGFLIPWGVTGWLCLLRQSCSRTALRELASPLGVLAFELLTSGLYFPEYRFVFIIVHFQVLDSYGFDLLIYATYPVDVKMILAALAWKRMFGGFWQRRPETLQKQSWEF